jgi:hypothetical protein
MPERGIEKDAIIQLVLTMCFPGSCRAAIPGPLSVKPLGETGHLKP